jgi:class 3 adenylate cyclase
MMMQGEPFTKIPWYRSFVFRFLFINTAAITILFALLFYSGNQAQRKQVALRFSSTLKTIVTNGAPLLNGSSLKVIVAAGDEEKAAFKNARQILKSLQLTNDLKTDGIYILRPDRQNKATYRFVVMLQEKTFVGDAYQPPKHIHRLYQRALSGQAVESSLYEDEHGSFISGVAPIFDESGQVEALLQADVRMSEYLNQVDADGRNQLFLGFAILLAVVLLGLRMRRQLSAHIGELMKGTIALNQRDFTIRVNLQMQDELGELARSINVALEHLQERAEMLKFLPTHTQQMIARVLEGGALEVDLAEAREVSVTILETDIRGFTALAERLEPTQTINLVNRYIEIQAERILEFGGSIDKYMGDAVLVVFEGPDSAARGLACAQQILLDIRALNAGAHMPVWIGAGLSHGAVVMGNMGCNDRMEHTVIGPAVNLAARLCSAALAGEVLIQETLISLIPAKSIEPLDLLRASIKVKGFSEPVDICRMTPGVDVDPSEKAE